MDNYKNTQNYKNTPEGRTVRQKYADILPLCRPEPIQPRMTKLNRAKIFSPFAALRGYDDEIADQNRVLGLVAKAELSDEDKGKLSDRLLQVKKGMPITLEYFHADPVYTPLGSYEKVSGCVRKINPMYRVIEMDVGAAVALKKSPPLVISFDDLTAVTGEGIVAVEDFLPSEDSLQFPFYAPQSYVGVSVSPCTC